MHAWKGRGEKKMKMQNNGILSYIECNFFYDEINYAMKHFCEKLGVLLPLVSRSRPLPSAAHDVPYHQHTEQRVWPLYHNLCDRGWNVNMTNDIQARVKFKKTWSRDQMYG